MIDRQYEKSEVILIVVLSIYCIALVIAALGYIFFEYANLQSGTGNNVNDAILLRLVVVVGVVGSLMRGASNLFDEVGRGTFDPRTSLSIVMRPLEGGAWAVISFFVFRSILLVLSRGASQVNPFGFLAIAGMAGMFSHKAADGLRERFGRLVSGSAPGGGD